MLAACTSTDSETQQRLDAASEQGQALGVQDDVLADATDEQRECADDRIGDSNLSMLQALTDATASGEQARIDLVGILIDCVPNLGSVDSYATFFTSTLTAALPPGSDVDDEEGACFLQFVIDHADDPAEMIVTARSPDTGAVLADGAAACFDEVSLARINGEAGSGPQHYGDDPALDALYDSCEAGDDRTCDLLYFATSEGSEYSVVATDCAGRGVSDVYCTPGITASPDGTADLSSPGLVTLETACVGGDMIACDTLFSLSPVGSDFETVGYTCGGKIAVGALPDCRTRFAE